MNLDKLKEAARRHELREEWRKAIEIYHRALEDLARGGEPADPSLYNRVGDLELKAGDSSAAIQAYEQAADTYSEQGFFNNAIALCGKILRVNPSRTTTYLRLAELHARKNVLAESRRNLQEYADRMLAAHQSDALAESLQGLAGRFGASGEFRQVLVEVLQIAGQRAKAAEKVEEIVRKLGLEDGKAPPAGAPEPEGGQRQNTGFVFLDTGVDIPGIRHGGPGGDFPLPDRGGDGAPPRDDGLAVVEAGGQPEVSPLPFIEPTVLSAELSTEVRPFELSGFEPTTIAPEDLLPGTAIPLVVEERAEVVEIPGLDPLPEFSAPLAGDLGFEPISVEQTGFMPLEDAPLLAEPLFDELEVEDRRAPGSPEELEQAMNEAAAEERWDDALQMVVALIALEPDVVPRHQKRVELAYRSGDRQHLIDAYLSLAQALERIGATENAGLVFRRVLDHDPGNPIAAAGLATLGFSSAASGPEPTAREAPPEEAAPAKGDFVDLGALILDPEPDRDTRMRVDQGEPEKEEDVDFRETLEQFKQGIAANIDASDFQAHYDLGIAFKEMGLLDEAIAQFQKALRAPEGRLRATEALGIAFYEKGRMGIAEAVLGRAVEALPGADDEKIALIYWWGRALEAQSRREEAVRCYERALAVDITFLDLGDRIQRLTAENVQ